MSKQLSGSITEHIIESQFLKETQKIMVYTPTNFTPLRTYDILICQDGQDYFQLGRIPRQVESLVEEAEIRELIIVGVPYPSVKERRKRYHPEGEKMEAYLRFLADELLPFLEHAYPVHPLAHGRTLAGDSLGASVSLLAALKYPALFGQVMMHSPFVDSIILDKIKKADNIEGLSIYHVIGLEETAVKTTDGQTLNFLEPNRMLHSELKEKPIHYTYHEFKGNHTWTFWQKDLANGLTTLVPFL